MDYYISKAEALDIVRFECGEWLGLAKTIEKRFDDLPHADVQPVRLGQWEEDVIDNGEYVTRCTACGMPYEYGHNENYCGYCGARMDGEQE